jgi:transcriptional regulator GlxA family with amidase domain
MISWLAQVRAEAKLISLPLDVDANQNSGHSLKWTDGAGKVDAVHADGRKASRIAIDAERRVGVTGVRRTEQRSERLNTPAPSERIKATIEWLKESYGSRISIPKLAERTLMSERNFLRRFRAEVGRSPHEYLCQIRLENARQLLVNTALPVDKIARHCGLFNGDHLRKHFLKHFGMTPSEYRRTHFHALQSLGSADAG